MRVTIRRTPALLLAALAAACTSRTAAPPTTPATAPTPVGPVTTRRPVAAHAGATFVLHVPADGNAERLPPEIDRVVPGARQVFGMIGEPVDVTQLGIHPTRPIVVSWGIVDPDGLRAMLTAPRAPARDAPFVIRVRIVVPIAEYARATSALRAFVNDPACALTIDGAGQRAAAIAGLRDPADRQAAASPGVAYFCRRESNAALAQFASNLTELTLLAAFGTGALLAEAAAPAPPDGALTARLEQAGFFAARTGVYTAPADEARLYTAMQLLQVRAAADGAEGSLRDELWRQGAREASANARLVESEPRLFTDLIVADRVATWTLTDAGKAFFASLALTPTASAPRLRDAIVSKLKPTGLFADRKALVQTVNEAGIGAYVLVHHFLWPHVFAFAAADPEVAPMLGAGWTDAHHMIEVDAKGGVLRAFGVDWKD